ncbi:glycohydrolase toxin TNT-related protein [Crossiella sp. CA-258035]|uniref:glycohydrolase toxin TNT-related protein n=1 Tax=Crossiella sp. CA-258035 TaxID=2981138 RepID=UPI0024BC1098|nr:glycohydrolase toxin TNT-related protein [Crossiella sp. CA-258035]WHT18931.1 glycohydrolase toxin TNT-related protein [Crossiella sp. CA-258035]
MIIKQRTYNGEFAYWQDTPYLRRRLGKQLYLVPLDGGAPDGDFERLPDGTFGRPVAAPLLESRFELQTIGFIDDEPYEVGYDEQTELVPVVWPGGLTLDTESAAQRGLEIYDRSLIRGQKPVERISKVVQLRWTGMGGTLDWRQFPLPVEQAELSGTGQPDPAPLLAGLTSALTALAPEGWQAIGVVCHALAAHMQLTTVVTLADGEEYYWSPPPQVSQWLYRLRLATYQPGAGAWFTADYRLVAGSEPVADFEFHAEPEWPFTAYLNLDPEHRQELQTLPRASDHTPDWLLRAAHRRQQELARQAMTSLSGEAGRTVGKPVRSELAMARLFDYFAEGEPPRAYRPVLPAQERLNVISYLSEAPVVLSSRGFAPDLLHPERESLVPMTYHTDGRWVWPGALAYYLREHGVTPPLELVNHIRSRFYEPPASVPKLVAQEATSVVMEMPERHPGAKDDWERARFAVRDFCVRFSVSRRYVSFGEYADEAWCVVRERDDRFSVFWWWANEQRKELEARFDDVSQAATYLIGQLYLNYPNLQRAEDEPLLPEEAPIQAMGGDPGLAAYDQIDSLILREGHEIERFGGPDGNTIFDAGTGFERTTLPPEFAQGPYGRFRLAGGDWKMLGAVTRADERQPGGARVYFLPKPLREYLASGLIVEIPPGEARQ